jgi:hypothetical protein
MARFTVEAANTLIDYNRRRLAQLAGNGATINPLMRRVVCQIELSVRSLERLRNELLSSEERRA